MSDPEEQAEARECLDVLLKLDAGLTDWEVDFVESVNKWTGDFTAKQIVTIFKIYDRV